MDAKSVGDLNYFAVKMEMVGRGDKYLAFLWKGALLNTVKTLKAGRLVMLGQDIDLYPYRAITIPAVIHENYLPFLIEEVKDMTEFAWEIVGHLIKGARFMRPFDESIAMIGDNRFRVTAKVVGGLLEGELSLE